MASLVVNDKTNVALGLAISLFAMIAYGAFWVGTIDSKVQGYEKKIESTENIAIEVKEQAKDIEYIKKMVDKIDSTLEKRRR